MDIITLKILMEKLIALIIINQNLKININMEKLFLIYIITIKMIPKILFFINFKNLNLNAFKKKMKNKEFQCTQIIKFGMNSLNLQIKNMKIIKFFNIIQAFLISQVIILKI